MSKIYCYSEGQQHPEIQALLKLWSISWKQCGWETPICLTHQQVSQHPRFREMLEAMSRLEAPVRPETFIRWLALDVRGGGTMTVPSVINYKMRPLGQRDVETSDNGSGVVVHTTDGTPCAVTATRDGARLIVDTLMLGLRAARELAQNKKVVTSATAMMQAARFGRRADCLEFGANGWKQAPMVYYSDRSKSPSYTNWSKAGIIQNQKAVRLRMS